MKKIISSILERLVSPILNAGRVAYVPFVQDWNGLGNRIEVVMLENEYNQRNL